MTSLNLVGLQGGDLFEKWVFAMLMVGAKRVCCGQVVGSVCVIELASGFWVLEVEKGKWVWCLACWKVLEKAKK